jgi:hypothetical protein
MIRSLTTRATFRGSLGEGADGQRISRLAMLSARQPPQGVVLLAEVEGEPVAAIGLFDGRTASDPVRSSVPTRIRLHLLRLQLRLIVAVHGL